MHGFLYISRYSQKMQDGLLAPAVPNTPSNYIFRKSIMLQDWLGDSNQDIFNTIEMPSRITG